MAEDLDVQTILSELDAEYTGKLPERAIREAQRRGTEMVPYLIDLIRNATKAVQAGDMPHGSGHLFALYLLTEFRAKEALFPIIEAVSLPGEGPFDLFGDAITEDLSRVLAALAADEPEIVDALLADRSLNEYVRWEAAQTYLHWVRDRRWTREEAVRRLRSHLMEALRNRDLEGATAAVSELVSYSPHETQDEINEAFRRGLVDRSTVNPDTVARSIAEGESWFQRELAHSRPTGIKDTVAELKAWASFQEAKPSRAVPRSYTGASMIENGRFDVKNASRSGSAIPPVSPRVGRNEPCPCGSGKKYKKCCARNNA